LGARGDRDALPDVAEQVAAAVARAIGFAPARVVLTRAGALPRTPSGKVAHGEVRKRLLDDSLDADGAVLLALPGDVS
jgi:acyl-coenzyme A synthetase/AMP-(fatty) acid ligase